MASWPRRLPRPFASTRPSHEVSIATGLPTQRRRTRAFTMSIQIVPYGAVHVAAVAAFNRRMAEGGSPWTFYADPQPDWIAPHPGQPVWREYHLAIDDDGEVRGAFALKPQTWLVRGQAHTVTDWQGPFSEGSVNAKFNTLGLRMIRDMLKKHPLLYSWGHGGNEQPMVLMLIKMGWVMHHTPFCLLVLNPARFLRLNALLRSSPMRRIALDLAAYSGVGFVMLKLLHMALRWRYWRPGQRSTAVATEVATFGPWADALWQRCKGRYQAIAVRDAASMNALVPAAGWPPGIRLKVDRGGQTIGWAVVMDTQMRGDARFGTLRVGSVVDCLADPDDTGEVVAVATRFLTRRGVDIVISNQAHPAWADGFAQNGFAVLPNKRMFAPSPALRALLEPFEETVRGLHLTNMDGHGPMAL